MAAAWRKIFLRDKTNGHQTVLVCSPRMLLRIRVARVRESPLRLSTAVEAGQIFLDFATDTSQFIEMHSERSSLC